MHCRFRVISTPERRSTPRNAIIRHSTEGLASWGANPMLHAPVVRGATLLALANAHYPDADVAADANRLMRSVLEHYLEARGIERPERRAGPGGNSKTTRRCDEDWMQNVIELGVNIDHVATLREARRTYEPDPVWGAVEAHLGGADGISVHLREDRRHIQDEDVRSAARSRPHQAQARDGGDFRNGRHRVPIAAGDGDARAGGPGRNHDRMRARRRRPREQAPRCDRAIVGRRHRDIGVIRAELAQVEASARIGARVVRGAPGALSARVPPQGVATPKPGLAPNSRH